MGLTAGDAAAAARSAGLLALGTAWASPAAAARWSAAVTEALRAHHRANPVDRVAPKDVAVRAALAAGCPADLTPALLDVLTAVGRVATERGGVRDAGHAVRLDPRQATARDALLAALAADPFSPPGLNDAAARAGAAAPLVREMEAAGDLVRLAPDLAVTPAALDDALTRLRDAYRTEGPLTAARAKQVLGTSRKYALPILEELDRRGATRRSGDTRSVVQPP